MENSPWFSVDIAVSTDSALSDEDIDGMFDAGADVIVGLGPGEWRSVWGVESMTAEEACRIALERLGRAIPTAEVKTATTRTESEVNAALL